MKSRDQRIDEMLDREEIRQLPIKYCHYIRNHMVEAIVDLYAEEGVFENDPEAFEKGGVHRGKDAIERLIRSNVGSADPWAFSHNHFIELEDSDHARGVVYMEFRFGRHNFVTSHIGTYDDRYVKREGTWKFLSRTLRTFEVLNRKPT